MHSKVIRRKDNVNIVFMLLTLTLELTHNKYFIPTNKYMNMDIKKLRGYDKDYENGYCPLGYEYVEGHTNFNGTYTSSYCRKIPKIRGSRNKGY